MKTAMMNTKSPFLILVLVLLLSSCTEEEAEKEAALDAYSKSVISYFQEIALGFEFGSATKITRRWETNMKIFVGGSPSAAHLAELNKIATEVNQLATINFKMEIVTDTLQSNFYVFFGSGDQYGAIYPGLKNLVGSNLGLFNVSWNGREEFVGGYMYVDIFRANELEQMHLLREELTQSLGLANDSFLYPESIFQQNFSTKVTQYAKIDKDLIRLLYHPGMKVGFNFDQVEVALTQILLAEII
jgi:hypothetical protein